MNDTDPLARRLIRCEKYNTKDCRYCSIPIINVQNGVCWINESAEEYAERLAKMCRWLVSHMDFEVCREMHGFTRYVGCEKCPQKVHSKDCEDARLEAAAKKVEQGEENANTR